MICDKITEDYRYYYGAMTISNNAYTLSYLM